jgi:hypothetical protein
MEVLMEIPVIEVDDASCETGNHREISKVIDRHYPCRIDISDGEFDLYALLDNLDCIERKVP